VRGWQRRNGGGGGARVRRWRGRRQQARCCGAVDARDGGSAARDAARSRGKHQSVGAPCRRQHRAPARGNRAAERSGDGRTAARPWAVEQRAGAEQRWRAWRQARRPLASSRGSAGAGECGSEGEGAGAGAGARAVAVGWSGGAERGRCSYASVGSDVSWWVLMCNAGLRAESGTAADKHRGRMAPARGGGSGKLLRLR